MEKKRFAPGIHNISNQAYHAADGVSRSQLWTFKQLPHKYWYQYLSGEYVETPDKEEFLIGEMLHTRLLEPDRFDERFFMMPKVNRTTKQGKADYTEALQLANGRALFTPDHWNMISGMEKSLMEQSVVRDILKGDVRFESSIFWEDSETGVLCKARPDLLNLPVCGDLKTTQDASYRAFQFSAMKYGYFLQAGMIYEALKSLGTTYEKFVFMCVEKKPPYAAGLYLLDDEAVQFGIDLFHQLLRKFATCKHNNEWPDYGIQMLMIPKYATMELETDE
jgi:exodeoxyribonuclease VIII